METNGFQPQEEVPGEGVQDESVIQPRAAEVVPPGCEESDWLGLPMAGQFPLSNWLFGQLDTRHQDASCASHSTRVIPESYLSAAQDIIASERSRQISLAETQHAAVASTMHGGHGPPADKKKYSCAECDRQFLEPRDLRRHVQNVHRKQIIKCPRCTRTFRNRPDNLKRHMAKYCKANSPKSGSIWCPH